MIRDPPVSHDLVDKGKPIDQQFKIGNVAIQATVVAKG
jgi:hypothetical protein